ncbi:YdcF family protein [Nocardia ninae]|uniref:DUF218 domain-containing protein n=1 Tax=Nocardia ninae NBRC 108245 TaxID=1210091 RepID=A0A511MTG2_9NOCA|nr:hypothetical protein NN4_83880 [Nocardia ninae NBRC 108245]
MPGLRRAGVFCGALLALVLLIGLAGLPVYVHPQTDPLRKADAIVVLGGTAYERFDLGIDLAQRGYAPTLLISRSTGLDDHEMDRYCAGRFDFTVSCFVPDPWTTEGEAHEIRRRAEQFGWRHLIVVTYTPHVSRARYIVAKCFDGELTMVASPSPSGLRFWTWMYLRQSAGYLRAFLSPEC